MTTLVSDILPLRPKLVIFDQYKTLTEGVDGDGSDPEAAIIKRFGLSMPYDEVEKIVCGTHWRNEEDYLDSLVKGLYLPDSHDTRSQLRETFADDVVRERVVEEAKPVLRTLRARGMRVALVSNAASPQYTHVTREGCDTADLFDAVAYSYETGDLKPDTKIYQRVLDSTGVDAKDAVMVGDSLRNDFKGALAAGIGQAVLLDRKRSHLDVHPRIESLSALLDLIPDIDTEVSLKEGIDTMSGVKQKMTKVEPGIRLRDVQNAAARIESNVVRTPVLTSPSFDAAVGHSVFFKCENLQRTGSFKYRGAMNAVFSLSDEVASRGVVCHSSGNHGTAVAAAAKSRGVPAVIVVPRTTAQVKVDAIKALGGRVVVCEPTQTARRETAEAEAAKLGDAPIIHPYNQAEVIAGQGTMGLELMNQVPDLDAILVPTSGGGMLTGIAVAVRGERPDASCRVHAVEPAGKRLGEAFETGTRILDEAGANTALKTICDAMPTMLLGELPWKLAHDDALVDRIVFSVNDAQVTDAMRYVYENLKLVIEPAAATGVAALLNGQVPGKGRRIGVILCGGNVDIQGKLPWQEDGEASALKRQRT